MNNDGPISINIVVLISIIILIFGEILPKTFIKNHANIGLVYLSPLLIIMYYLFLPIIKFIVRFKWLEIYKNISDEEKRQDLQSTFEQVDDTEAMEKEQQEMMKRYEEHKQKSENVKLNLNNEVKNDKSTDVSDINKSG